MEISPSHPQVLKERINTHLSIRPRIFKEVAVGKNHGSFDLLETVLKRNMKISARIQWGGSEVIFHHLRSRVEDVIYFLYKPQSQLSKIEKKELKVELFELTLWLYMIFLFSLLALSIQVNLPLRKSDEEH